jgi:hypothetical protein
MPSSASNPTPALLAIFALAAILASAVLLARFVSRRERRSKRAGGLALRRALRDVARGRLDAESLREFAAACDRETFWSALEAGARTPHLRRGVARVLAATEHVDDERRALRDDSSWRRELAARRLGLVRSRRTRSSLRRAMVRGPEWVTVAAALSLARQRDLAALRWLLAHPQRLAKRTARTRIAVLRAFGRRGRTLLTEALAAGPRDPALERAILDALDSEAAPGALTHIRARLAHHDPELRTAAARALGRIGDAGAGDALLAALADSEWPVRAQAARSLGGIGDARAVPALAACLTDRAWWVRRHAAYALAALGEAGRAELERAVSESPDRYAREMADEALEQVRRRASGE